MAYTGLQLNKAKIIIWQYIVPHLFKLICACLENLSIWKFWTLNGYVDQLRPGRPGLLIFQTGPAARLTEWISRPGPTQPACRPACAHVWLLHGECRNKRLRHRAVSLQQHHFLIVISSHDDFTLFSTSQKHISEPISWARSIATPKATEDISTTFLRSCSCNRFQHNRRSSIIIIVTSY